MNILEWLKIIWWLSLISVPMNANAEFRYSVNPIGVIGSKPAAINNNGEVVGSFQFENSSRAFLYSNDRFYELGTLGGTASYANDINDSGMVVGGADNADGHSRAFVYENGGMLDLGTLGGAYGSATSINNNGQIVGSAATPEGAFAFIYTPGLGMKNLGTLPGGVGSRAEGINESGVVTGGSTAASAVLPIFHAFEFSARGMVDIDSPSSIYSVGQAINDIGDIVGWMNAGLHIDHGFVYSSGAMTDIGTLYGFGSSGAFDVNNCGQVVGWSEVAGKETTAILYEGGTMINLETLIDPDGGWKLQAAYSINDHSQIAAYGCKGTLCQGLILDPLSPVPEPQAYMMLLIGYIIIRMIMR